MWKISLLVYLFIGVFELKGEILESLVYGVSVNGIEDSIGNVKLKNTPYGVLLIFEVTNVRNGVYGLYIHQNSSCMTGMSNAIIVPAKASGGIFDDGSNEKEIGVFYEDKVFLGNLPNLYVYNDEFSKIEVLIPKIFNIDSIKDHSLVIVSQGGKEYDKTKAKEDTIIACSIIR